MVRRAAKVDSNQPAIVKGLRQISGVSVAVTSGAGDGFPDLVVGYRGNNFLFEIKDGSKPPSQRALTPDQVRFHREWTGQICVIENLDDAMLLILGAAQ